MPSTRRRILWTTLLTLTALMLVATLPALARPAVDGCATRTPRPTPSPTPGCVVTATHRADPLLLGVGQETTATVHVAARCTAAAMPLHIEFVLDASSNVDDRGVKDMVESVDTIIKDLHLLESPEISVGFVGFNDRVLISCPLGNDEARALSCLRRIGSLHRRQAGPGTQRLDRAITAGLAQLRRGRRGLTPGYLRDVMIIVSSGPAGDDCRASERSAGQVKADKVLTMSVCVGTECDQACMARLASSRRYFFRMEDVGAIVQAFQKILEEVLKVNLKRLDFHYLPAEVMRYMPDSAEPAPEATLEPDGRLSWRVNYLPKDGVTFTLRLAPTGAGRQPLAREAGGEWLDNQNRAGQLAVPTAEVDVTP